MSIWANVVLQVGSRLLGAPRLLGQVCLATAVLASLTARQGTRLGHLARGGTVLEVLEQLDGGLGGQVLIVFVVDLDHGSVDAGA